MAEALVDGGQVRARAWALPRHEGRRPLVSAGQLSPANLSATLSVRHRQVLFKLYRSCVVWGQVHRSRASSEAN